MQESYRESLHKTQQSTQEWAPFFVLAPGQAGSAVDQAELQRS